MLGDFSPFVTGNIPVYGRIFEPADQATVSYSAEEIIYSSKSEAKASELLESLEYRICYQDPPMSIKILANFIWILFILCRTINQ